MCEILHLNWNNTTAKRKNSRFDSAHETLAQYESQSGDNHDGGAHGPDSPSQSSHRETEDEVSAAKTTLHNRNAVQVLVWVSVSIRPCPSVWVSSDMGLVNPRLDKVT